MLYAILKTLHLLSIILWIGGMAFVLFFLRPALGTLQPQARVTLMRDVLRRFFGAVSAAIIIVLVSGLWMMGQFASGGAAAGGVHMPMSWMVMATLGLLMMAIFGHIRFVLYKRLQCGAGRDPGLGAGQPVHRPGDHRRADAGVDHARWPARRGRPAPAHAGRPAAPESA
jgi:uncharacterized membrane protein